MGDLRQLLRTPQMLRRAQKLGTAQLLPTALLKWTQVCQQGEQMTQNNACSCRWAGSQMLKQRRMEALRTGRLMQHRKALSGGCRRVRHMRACESAPSANLRHGRLRRHRVAQQVQHCTDG